MAASLFAFVLAAAIAVIPSTHAASTSGTVVGATVPSATTLTMAGCSVGMPGITSFGTLLPGSSARTANDCTIGFGSSNNTSMLRMRQADRYGRAMVQQFAGSLDTTFDGDGLLFDDVEPGRNDSGQGATWDVSGRLLVVHSADGGATLNDIVISRYSSAGVLDPTWGTAGRVRISLGAWESGKLFVNDDGSMWLLGQRGANSFSGDALIVKVTAAGALDTTFNGTGWRTYNWGYSWQWFNSLVPLRDGTWIANAGYFSGGALRERLVRLDAQMNVDATWNAGTGYAEVGGDVWYGCRAPFIEDTGKIVCAGYRGPSGTNTAIAVMRRNADGTPDTTFDGDGIATYTVNAGTLEGAYGIRAASGGGYIVAGATNIGNIGIDDPDAVLLRITSTGALDPSFDGDGRWSTRFSGTSSLVGDVWPDGQGGFAFSGYSKVANNFRVVVGRVTASGQLDTSYNGTGYRIVDVTGGTGTNVFAGAGGDDQRIVVVGYRTNGDDDTAIAVFAGDSVADYVDGADDWDQGTNGFFGVCLASVGGGASAVWSSTGSCPATDGVYWRSLPTAESKVASASSGSTSASVALRFGLRTKSSQQPGAYAARFDVMVYAPDA